MKINMKQLFTVTLLLISIVGNAQTKKEKDQQAIKDMCGCYEVKFKYTETFAPDIAYEKAYDYKASALEWAELVTDKEDLISIQHLLIVYDTMIIKHWRQDWEYENPKLFKYKEKNTWDYFTKTPEEVKGQWAQKVYQVDDSPRYSGSATWVHVDGKKSWQNRAESPLPRREYSKRSDYNLMIRGNDVQITENGWLHEQDNDKIIRKDGEKDELLAQEKGYNIYTKVDDSRCIAAQNWWKDKRKLWKRVRKVWDEVYENNKQVKLKSKVDDKLLYRHMFGLKNNASKKEIREIINKFLE